jgi:hypothetical protein
VRIKNPYLSKKEDPYIWTRRRAESLFADVTNWTDEQGDVYNKVDIWAVKKLLAIEWFIKPFTQIAKKYFSPIHDSGFVSVCR